MFKKEIKTCTRKRVNSKVNVHLQKSNGMVKKRIDFIEKITMKGLGKSFNIFGSNNLVVLHFKITRPKN